MMGAPMTTTLRDPEQCVDHILEKLGSRLVVGTPLGIGKPNTLLNALYARARADRRIRLELVTALSLNPPRGKSELEERFLKPIRARVWGDYPRLAYVDDRDAGELPENVRVIEFYLRSGSGLGVASAQADYISSNYTHVARDMASRGANLILQALALRTSGGARAYSMSSNPDVTSELLARLAASGTRHLMVAQINRRLPWLGGRAAIAAEALDLVLDDERYDHRPFAVPHEPVDAPAWAVGVHASSLVRDAGTLQVGIGALGDAVCHALRLRQQAPSDYKALLDALGRSEAMRTTGGEAPFTRGLYIASELLSGALFSLVEAGIATRRVYEDEATQEAANALPDGAAPLPGGTSVQGAFFVGSSEFYGKLHALGEEQAAQLDMTSVSEVNRIYTHYRLEHLQRSHARFVNITMMATLLGSAVSDQIANGQVVSGVGGQSDFVNMAHQLPDGRSVLLLRATREHKGKVESNILFQYPHATVPRHMRDLFVTEYGVADLRGKTDAECVEAMLAIADARFQEPLLAEARGHHKVGATVHIPERARGNLPERVSRAVGPFQQRGVLPRMPFGSELTDAELELAGRLKRLERALTTPQGRLALVRAVAIASRDEARVRWALEHLELATPRSLKERALARVVTAAYGLP
jgi:acyl-CoA hydrolase